MLINKNILKPSTCIAITIIVIILGLVSLKQLPVKLLPDISSTSLQIETRWGSASPYEIESNILEKQENELRDIVGLEDLISTSYQGRGVIKLSFSNTVNKTELLLNVLSKLNNIKEFPVDAEPPQVKSFSSAESLVFLFIRKLEGNSRTVDDYNSLIDLTVRTRLESIPGVAGVQVFIGAEPEFQIIVDPIKASQLGIPLSSIAKILKNQNDITAGTMDVGRKKFLIRLEATDSPKELEQTVLEWRSGRPILLKDIASIEMRKGERNSFAIFNGEPAIGLRLTREAGANVLSTLSELFTEMDSLNHGVLLESGLKIEKSFDPSVFINRALFMVSSNIVLGIFIAIIILFAFFRRWKPTLVVAISVPISLTVTFTVLALFDRTINVITLAGIAFATGMIMDASIVVLESITSEREKGKSPLTACIDGTSRVWNALFASTLTTVAIFLPIAITKDPSAQLFVDLSITIVVSISISLLVATFIIPVLYSKLYRSNVEGSSYIIKKEHPSRKVEVLIRKLTASNKARFSWVTFLIIMPIMVTSFMLPDLDYLPPLRKDSIDTFMRFPSSAHLNLIEKEIVTPMAERLNPYLEGSSEPTLKNYYIAVSPGAMSMGVRVEDQDKLDMLKKLIQEDITSGFPDTEAYSSQGSITGKFGGNRSFTIHMLADDLAELNDGVKKIIPLIKDKLLGVVVKSSPKLDANQPELRLAIESNRLGETGWSHSEMQDVIRILGNGLYIGEYFNGQSRIDKIIKIAPVSSPYALLEIPLQTKAGYTTHLGNIVNIEETLSPIELKRVNRRRAISLIIVPPPGMTLGNAVDGIKDLLPEMKNLLPENSDILMGETANKLNQSVNSLILLMISAIGLLFLILTVMLGSIKDSFIIIITIPLATVGGILMLNILNLFITQPLDLLTMIGFVILTGLVVNNSILLVCSARDLYKSGIDFEEAIYLALRQRLRPILISTLTSVFGMLPLLLNPETGSEIYRGLAAVIVGGMSLSLIFTLILIPCLLLLQASYVPIKKMKPYKEIKYA
jgi:multidrug efflux pump subunit AcrB